MNRMGPLILVLAAANALAAAAMAGAAAAVVIFVGIVAAGWLFFRRGGATEAPPELPAGPVGREGIVVGRQGADLLVRLGGRDWPARAAGGTAQPGYGDAVRVIAQEGAVLVVRGT